MGDCFYSLIFLQTEDIEIDCSDCHTCDRNCPALSRFYEILSRSLVHGQLRPQISWHEARQALTRIVIVQEVPTYRQGG
jgi:hypothetical protein